VYSLLQYYKTMSFDFNGKRRVRWCTEVFKKHVQLKHDSHPPTQLFIYKKHFRLLLTVVQEN